jgi:hypothetical protein
LSHAAAPDVRRVTRTTPRPFLTAIPDFQLRGACAPEQDDFSSNRQKSDAISDFQKKA